MIGRVKYKSKSFKQLMVVTIIIALLAQVFCLGRVNAATIKLSQSELNLKIGQSKTLKVLNTKKKVTWSSTNKKIATVSQKGKVTAKEEGQVLIKAKVENMTYTCQVYSQGPYLEDRDIVSFVGYSKRLSVVDNERKQAKWTSSNPSVVKIDYFSKDEGPACYADLEMLKTGTSKITAKIGNITMTCNVKVVKKNDDINKSNTKILKLAKKYNLDVLSKNHIEFGAEYSGVWVSLYDDYVGFVIPSTGTGEETFISQIEEFIAITLPQNGEKVAKYLFEDFLTTRSLVLEDKEVKIHEYGFYRFLEITNKDY